MRTHRSHRFAAGLAAIACALRLAPHAAGAAEDAAALLAKHVVFDYPDGYLLMMPRKSP